MSNGDWLAQFRERAARQRVPVSGVLELTRRCNLACVHCYLGAAQAAAGGARAEMTTAQVRSVLDQVADAGCLYLLITGGDPMIREDFPEVYRHARERGLVVTVFCNGLLVTDEIVELFREHPPREVEISLYGAAAETHEAVTRVGGSFAACLAGVRRLQGAEVRVALKTMVMTANREEVAAMRTLAAELGAPFRADTALFPCVTDRDHTPLDLRLPPEEAVAEELSDPEALRRWVTYVEEREDLPPSDTLYVCGAGMTAFYVDASGLLSPCLMTTLHRFDLLESNFASLWTGEISRLHGRQAGPTYPCRSCEVRLTCTACPAANHLETGHEEAPADHACASSRLRWRAIARARSEEPKGGGVGPPRAARACTARGPGA